MGWTRHITWGITPGDLLTRVIKHWDDPPSRHITWVTFFRGRTAGQVFPGFPIQNLGFQDLSKGFLKGQFDISKNRGVSSTCSLESQVIKLEAPWTQLIRAPWNNHKLETIHHWHQLQFRPKKNDSADKELPKIWSSTYFTIQIKSAGISSEAKLSDRNVKHKLPAQQTQQERRPVFLWKIGEAQFCKAKGQKSQKSKAASARSDPDGSKRWWLRGFCWILGWH